MDLGVFKFVFVICIKNDAVLINEAHHRSLPPGTGDEIHD